MKPTFIITWVFLQLCTLVSQGQTENTGEKLIKIVQTVETDVVYSDLDRISVKFTVNYTNQPDKEKKETNYIIDYKSTDSLLDASGIRLNAPINFLTLKAELNQKIQVKGDTVRPIQDNTIMKLFVMFSSVAQMEGKRLPAGNLVIQDYIATYKKDIYKLHEERQAFVSSRTSKVMVLNIEIDSLAKEIEIVSDTIFKRNIVIKSLENKISNSEIYKSRYDKILQDLSTKNLELTKSEGEIEILIQGLGVDFSAAESLTKTKKSNYDSQLNQAARNISLLKDAKQSINKLDDHISVARRLASIGKFDSDTTVNSYSIASDSLKSILKVDENFLKELFSNGIVTKEDGEKVQISRKILDEKLTDFEKLKSATNNAINVMESTAKADTINSVITKDELAKSQKDFAEAIKKHGEAKRLQKEIQEEKKQVETEESKIKESIKELDNKPGLQINLTENKHVYDSLTTHKSRLLDRLAKLRKRAKDENRRLIAEGIFQIFKLHIQIERGYIERIQVFIPDSTGNLSIYENIHAIGFSSVKNFMQFRKTKLFARLSPERFVYLSDVIANYENFLENYTRDYCPADTTINDFKPSDGFMSLKRDNFKNLFDTKVFTDLEGIDSNKPNGLLQFEVSRRFNIKTSRMQIRNSRSDIGWLTYFNAFGSLNKIEKDKRVLELRNEDIVRDNQVISPYYATSLDIRRYQNFGLGGELNLFLFDWPDGKMTSYLDVGAAYGHTPLAQRPLNIGDPSIRRDSVSISGHSSTIYPKISVELLSEKRIGFVLSYQYNRTVMYSNNHFKPIASYAKSNLTARTIEPFARNSHVVECYIRAMPTNSRDGQFFFRARYFIQQRDRNTFFAQLQFGYSYNIKLKGFEE